MKNNDNETALSKVTLEKPCSQNWDEMVGDERERFCSMCSLNVYNLSSMTRDEAEEFLQVRNDGSVCLNYISDAEGKVITDNVPRPLRPLRDRLQPLLRVASSFVAAFGLFATGVLAQEQRLGGKPCAPIKRVEGPRLLGAPPVLSQAEQEAMNAEKILKDKIKSLESKKKLNTKLGATGILDLANFYRGKDKLQDALTQYDRAIEILKKLPKEKDLLKNAELNKSEVKKQIDSKAAK